MWAHQPSSYTGGGHSVPVVAQYFASQMRPVDLAQAFVTTAQPDELDDCWDAAVSAYKGNVDTNCLEFFIATAAAVRAYAELQGDGHRTSEQLHRVEGWVKLGATLWSSEYVHGRHRKAPPPRDGYIVGRKDIFTTPDPRAHGGPINDSIRTQGMSASRSIEL